MASASRNPTLNAFACWHGIILENVQAMPGEWSSRSGGHRGNHDPMIRGKAASALEPRRIVVELRPDEFEALDKACGRVAQAVFLKLLALGVIAEAECELKAERASLRVSRRPD